MSRQSDKPSNQPLRQVEAAENRDINSSQTATDALYSSAYSSDDSAQFRRDNSVSSNRSITDSPGTTSDGISVKTEASLPAQIIQASACRAGEGPYQVLDRMMGHNISAKEKQQIARLLKLLYRKEHNEPDVPDGPNDPRNVYRGLPDVKVGYQYINDKNLPELLKVPEFAQWYQKQIHTQHRTDPAIASAEHHRAATHHHHKESRDKEGSRNQESPAGQAGDAPTSTDTGSKTAAAPDSKAKADTKPLDDATLEKTAEAIRKATGNDNWIARWADRDKINELLEDKTRAERDRIDELYQKKYGLSLESEMRKFENDQDYEKFNHIRYKNDHDAGGQAAGRISEALLESHNWFEGRSSKAIEKDIRDTLSVSNSKQIARMEEAYQQEHPGHTLHDDIMNNGSISEATKRAAAIYLKGTDQRDDLDTLNLAQIALESKNIDMFQEAMRGASKEAREKFQAAGGAEQVKEAFGGHWYNALLAGFSGNVTDKELRHAQEYAQQGKLSAATQINDNAGVIHWTNNDAAIESTFKNMSEDDRKSYLAGKAISLGTSSPEDMSEADKARAKEYYTQTHEAMVGAGRASEIEKWERLIARQPEPDDTNKTGAAQDMSAKSKAPPEDAIHAHIGHWGGSVDIMAALRAVQPADIAQLKTSYAHKYGSDLESDLLDKLSGKDKAEAIRILHANMDTQERFDEERDDYYRRRSGFTNWLTEDVGRSGTGYQSDDALNQYATAITQSNQAEVSNSSTVDSTATIDKARDKFDDAVNNFKEAKQSAANAAETAAVVGGTIAAGAVATVLTGGAAAPAVAVAAEAEISAEVGATGVAAATEAVVTTEAAAETAATGAAVTTEAAATGTTATEAAAEATTTEAATAASATGAATTETVAAQATGTAASLTNATLTAGATGAIITPLAKKALEDDYKLDSSEALADAGIGAGEGLLTVFGPAQVAKLFNLGKAAASAAAKTTIDSLTTAAVTDSGQQLLKQEAAKIIEDGSEKILRNALAHGAPVSKQAVMEVADKAVADEITGAARNKAVAAVSDQLYKTLDSSAKTTYAGVRGWIQKEATIAGLNAAGGGMGGAVSGLAMGGMNWDPRKSTYENLKMIEQYGLASGLSGAAMGAGMSTGFRSAGRLWGLRQWSKIASTDAPTAPSDPPATPANPAPSPSDSATTSHPAADATSTVNTPSDSVTTSHPAVDTTSTVNTPSDSATTSHPAADATSTVNTPSDSVTTSHPAADTTSTVNTPSDSATTSHPAADTTPTVNTPSDSVTTSHPAVDTTSTVNPTLDSTVRATNIAPPVNVTDAMKSPPLQVNQMVLGNTEEIYRGGVRVCKNSQGKLLWWDVDNPDGRFTRGFVDGKTGIGITNPDGSKTIEVSVHTPNNDYTKTEYVDGSFKADYHDGRTQTVKYDPKNGSTTTRFVGLTAGDSYTLITQPDGSYIHTNNSGRKIGKPGGSYAIEYPSQRPDSSGKRYLTTTYYSVDGSSRSTDEPYSDNPNWDQYEYDPPPDKHNGARWATTQAQLKQDGIPFETPPLVQNENTQQGTGWKLHLSAFESAHDPLTRQIADFLEARHIQFKIGRGGTQRHGRGMTIYLGDRDTAEEAAKALDKQFGRQLPDAASDTNPEAEEVQPMVQRIDPSTGQIRTTVSARFDADLSGNYSSASFKGVPPVLTPDGVPFRMFSSGTSLEPGIVSFADQTPTYRKSAEALADKYGAFYTGTGVYKRAIAQGLDPQQQSREFAIQEIEHHQPILVSDTSAPTSANITAATNNGNEPPELRQYTTPVDASTATNGDNNHEPAGLRQGITPPEVSDSKLSPGIDNQHQPAVELAKPGTDANDTGIPESYQKLLDTTDAYKAAAEQDQYDPEICIKLGDAHRSLDKWEPPFVAYREAKNAYLEALKRDPTNYKACQRLSDLYKTWGDTDPRQVYADLADIVKSGGTINSDTFHSLATRYKKTGKIDEALAVLDEAVAYNNNDSVAYRQIGDIQKELGNVDRAKEFYHIADKQRIFNKPAIPRATSKPRDMGNDTTMQNWSHGTILAYKDGTTTVIDFTSNTKCNFDRRGRLVKTTSPSQTLRYFYNASGRLSQVKSSNGEVLENGTASSIEANPEGGVRTIGLNGTRQFGIDGSELEVLPNGRVNYLEADYDVEIARLNDLIKTEFPQASRSARFQGLLKDFETESAKHGITQEQRALFYQQINRILEDNSTIGLTPAQRANLAEQVLNHAAHPTTIDQGDNRTCSIAVLENRLYTRNPEKIAQLVADIANNNKYITRAGAVIDAAHLHSGIQPDLEARLSMDLQAEDNSSMIKLDGGRDWASQIAQTALGNVRLTDSSMYIAGDRLVNPNNLIKDSNGNLIWDDKPNQMQALFDADGEPIKELTDGETAFNKAGEPILRHSNPGEVAYDKVAEIPDSPFYSTAERFIYKHAGKNIPLRDYQGQLINSPRDASKLIDIEKDISGEKTDPFEIVARNVKGFDETSQINVSSAEELGKALELLKEEDNLPGVLAVHTSHAPWSQLSGTNTAVGESGGWHAVNVQDYDPVTKMVKITNQWGSKNDFTEEGIALDTVFQSMRAPVTDALSNSNSA